MSIWGELSQLAGHAWDGNSAMAGDVAAIGMDLGGMLPLGKLLPDGNEARDWTNNLIGADPKAKMEGNLGNHIGSILGAASGLVGGPGGMAVGASLGSAAGGWIADLFGDDSNKTTATKSPR